MNQKIENELNLSLLLDEKERRKTNDLETGYDLADDEWELIVKYAGDVTSALEGIAVSIKLLIGGYAIIRIKTADINILVQKKEIIYVEKPKKLFYDLDFSATASCVDAVYEPPYELSGKGILVAVIDSGIDYFHMDFRNPDGSTRLIGILDENKDVFYDKAAINKSLADGERLITDVSGHGTHVTGIAAGNGSESDGLYRGVAYEADILVVKLGDDEFFSTARLMEGIDFILKKAMELNEPVAINLSFGNNYGSHDGTSLVETYIDLAASLWKCVFCVGSGNEADKRIHGRGTLVDKTVTQELIIGEFESSIDVQLWKNYWDDFRISIITPDNKKYGPIYYKDVVTKYFIEQGMIYVYYGEPVPYSLFQEIFFQLIPNEFYLKAGSYRFILEPVSIVSGNYDLWLPAGNSVSVDTGFVNSIPDITLTIPSTSLAAVTVGAYDPVTKAYAPFSGRGYTRNIKTVKPDIAAPGIDVMSAAVNGGYVRKSGTSMATPFVTGAAALLMEWGIVKGNDVFLYGQKVKAYLIKGAKKISGEKLYPNPKIGDCVILVLG